MEPPPTSYRLWIIEAAHSGVPVRMWLADADVDADDGFGDIQFTPLREFAKAFPSLPEAMNFWTQQSTVRPLRDDGQPNRPITAFSVQPVADGQDPL